MASRPTPRALKAARISAASGFRSARRPCSARSAARSKETRAALLWALWAPPLAALSFLSYTRGRTWTILLPGAYDCRCLESMP
jgi:hypothetical protein